MISTMIEVKQIDDRDLQDFIVLFIKYNKCLVTKHNSYVSTKVLIDKLSLEASLAIGLYKDSRLVGFTLGNGVSNEVFHFTDMYILPNYRYHTSRLLRGSENLIRPTYKVWTSESHTKDGIRMFEHYGAQIAEIKYYKEI